LLAHFQHLVDLLLVFHHGKTHIGVVDREHTFGRRGVLIQRDRDRTQRLGGQHGGIQARTVGPHHNQMLAAVQSCLMQAARQVLDHAGQITPGGGFARCRIPFPARQPLSVAGVRGSIAIGETWCACRILVGHEAACMGMSPTGLP